MSAGFPIWKDLLLQSVDRPGEWVEVRRMPYRSTSGVAANLRKRHYGMPFPEDDWEFTTKKEGTERVFWAKYNGSQIVPLERPKKKPKTHGPVLVGPGLLRDILATPNLPPQLKQRVQEVLSR